jgi:Integrase core domain
VLLGRGKKVAEVVEALGVSEVTYRDELLDREVFHSLREAQVLIEAWRRHYNAVRPHSALGHRPPATGHPPPRPSRGRHGRRYVQPLATAPMSCITDAAPGPTRWGRSLWTLASVKSHTRLIANGAGQGEGGAGTHFSAYIPTSGTIFASYPVELCRHSDRQRDVDSCHRLWISFWTLVVLVYKAGLLLPFLWILASERRLFPGL